MNSNPIIYISFRNFVKNNMSSIFRGPGTSPGMYPPRIACFVCGAEVPADYPLYPEAPIGNSGTTPHFPFLLSLEPPLGCRPPSPGGVAKSCRVCYSTLMRQWDEYEKGGVATDRYAFFVISISSIFWIIQNYIKMSNYLFTEGCTTSKGLRACLFHQ